MSTADSSLVLDATELAFTWAVYSWGGLDADNQPVEVMPSLSDVNSQYWIAFSDYSRHCWRFSGPHVASGAAIPAAPGAAMISPDGSAYIALIVPRGHSLRLDWLNLVTSLDAGMIHVDAAAAGPGDGSAGAPFPTLEAGVAAAQDGDTVIVAPGEYAPPGEIVISSDIRIEGSGACRTQVNQALEVTGPPGESPVVITGLHCATVQFGPSVEAATELQVINCVLDEGPVLAWSNGHRVLYQGCKIDTGDPEESAFRFSHNDSACVSIIRGCHLTGIVAFSCGSGGKFLVEGCTITGSIYDSSIINQAEFSNNTITNGSITDKSSGVTGIDDELITGNHFINGYVSCKGMTARIEDNYFDNRALGVPGLDMVYGSISCKSGTPTNIIGNVILSPDVPYDGDLFDGEGEFAAIDTSAGEGVVEHNIITGGSFGIFSKSAATSISHNSISDVHLGIYSVSSADIIGNTITGSAMDGMMLSARSFRLQQNEIRDCAGAAVRISGTGSTLAPPDCGGGALGSLGQNIMTGYGTYAFVLETLGAELPQVFAQNNYWGSADTGSIAAAVYDGSDDPLLTAVSFEPFLLAEP